MKQYLFTFLIVGGTSLFLSACGVQDKIGEKILEKQIEGQTGQKVDIDNKGDKVTIKTDDGQVQYSAGGDVKIPDGFPKELIIGSEIKPIMAMVSTGGISLSYATNEEVAVVTEKIKKLVDNGWKKEMELTDESGIMFSLSKDKERVTITTGVNKDEGIKGKTQVTVILVKEE